MRKSLYILALGLIMMSCSIDTECRQDMRVNMGISLVGDSLCLAEDSINYEHATFTSVSGMQVWGAGRDSLIVTGDRAISLVQVPLKKDTGECAYIFSYRDAKDTLYVHYDRTATFVSLACGCAVFATIDTVYTTHTFLDSIQRVNDNVTTTQETHLKLYYHVP